MPFAKILWKGVLVVSKGASPEKSQWWHQHLGLQQGKTALEDSGGAAPKRSCAASSEPAGPGPSREHSSGGACPPARGEMMRDYLEAYRSSGGYI